MPRGVYDRSKSKPRRKSHPTEKPIKSPDKPIKVRKHFRAPKRNVRPKPVLVFRWTLDNGRISVIVTGNTLEQARKLLIDQSVSKYQQGDLALPDLGEMIRVANETPDELTASAGSIEVMVGGSA